VSFLRQYGLQDDVNLVRHKAGRLPLPSFLGGRANCNGNGFYSHWHFEPQFDYSYAAIMRSYFEQPKAECKISQQTFTSAMILAKSHHCQYQRTVFKTVISGGLRALQGLNKAGDIRAFWSRS